MKNTLLLLSSFFFLSIASCKSKKETAVSDTKPSNENAVSKGVKDQNCAAEISFGSYGSGIDGASYEKILAAIETRKLQYTKQNVGREGETRFCLPLTELKDKEKSEFIEQLKKMAKEGQLVSLSVR